MPIKFRCQHCQQLLGISRSRAGAVVDCPGCGRSLRVPDLDGQTKKLPDPGSAARRDSGLLSALTELSELGDRASSDVASNEPAASTIASSFISPGPVTSSEPIEVEISSPAPAEPLEPEDARPYAIEESLQELTSLQHSGVAEQSAPSNAEDSESSRNPRAFAVFLGGGAALLLLLGFGAGRFTAPESGAPADIVNESRQEQPPVEQDADGGTKIPPAAGTRILRGSVSYLDAAGNSVPDSESLVMILPVSREGQVLWNARSLRRAADHPDRRAVIQALRALGADVAVADEQGNFQLLQLTSEEANIIAVSRHKQRPDDVEVDSSLQDLLAEWFDSASHICGRLAIQQKAVPEDSESITIEFGN